MSLLAHAVLPRHLGLLVLGGSDGGLGDVAGRGRRRSALLLWDARGFGGQGGAWLMEVVERRLVGQVVWVEGLVKVVVGLEVGQSIRLLRWLRGSAQGQTQQLGLKGFDGRGGVPSSRGGVAAAGRRFGCVQDVRLRCAAPDGLLGRVQVLWVGGPGLAAGGRLKGVCATGRRVRRGGGATKGAVAEGGDT